MSLEKKLQFSVLRSVESFQDPRPSIKKRMADGKAYRKIVSFSDQGPIRRPNTELTP